MSGSSIKFNWQIRGQYLCLAILVLFSSCKITRNHQETTTNMGKKKAIDVQGHRGCRGLLPENTIPAFMKAMELGVTTLELDLVISKDNEVVISHEPFFNHEITTLTDGSYVKKKHERKHNIYKLTRKALKKYDVGLKPHPKFSKQKNIKAIKPTLKELAVEVRKKAKELKVPIPYYNVEIKRVPEQDNEFHPGAHDFARLVLNAIYEAKIDTVTYIQSFDVASLEEVKKIDNSIPLVYLIANKKKPRKNLKELSFIPEVYSPYYKLVDKDLVKFCKKNKMKLIPWTVNTEKDIKKQLELGVDGIISDYPDVLLKVVKKSSLYKVQ